VAKNLVGAFYQPRLVLSDVSLIRSLPNRQLRSGLAEIIKYGVIKDRKIFAFLEANYSKVLSGDVRALEYLVARCSRIKAGVVAKDELDTKGVRALLNYGHTMGHAIEAASGYSNRYNHGEAVAIGMIVASRISASLGRINPGEAPASGNYDHVFEQHLPAGTLSWPELDYQTFKDMALAHGRYYGTDAAGIIYRDGIKDSAHRVDFLTEFGVPNRDTAPYDLVFIDTIDAQPPAADGSNLATVSVSGNGLGLKGVFWMGANFSGGGVGSPPFILDAEDPNGDPPPGGRLSKIFLEGVLTDPAQRGRIAASRSNCHDA
jgi:hypothetical protein